MMEARRKQRSLFRAEQEEQGQTETKPPQQLPPQWPRQQQEEEV